MAGYLFRIAWEEDKTDRPESLQDAGKKVVDSANKSHASAMETENHELSDGMANRQEMCYTLLIDVDVWRPEVVDSLLLVPGPSTGPSPGKKEVLEVDDGARGLGVRDVVSKVLVVVGAPSVYIGEVRAGRDWLEDVMVAMAAGAGPLVVA